MVLPLSPEDTASWGRVPGASAGVKQVEGVEVRVQFGPVKSEIPLEDEPRKRSALEMSVHWRVVGL